MIKYYVGAEKQGSHEETTYWLLLKDGLDTCPNSGYDNLEDAIEEAIVLQRSGYQNIKVFKTEEVEW